MLLLHILEAARSTWVVKIFKQAFRAQLLTSSFAMNVQTWTWWNHHLTKNLEMEQIQSIDTTFKPFRKYVIYLYCHNKDENWKLLRDGNDSTCSILRCCDHCPPISAQKAQSTSCIVHLISSNLNFSMPLQHTHKQYNHHLLTSESKYVFENGKGFFQEMPYQVGTSIFYVSY